MGCRSLRLRLWTLPTSSPHSRTSFPVSPWEEYLPRPLVPGLTMTSTPSILPHRDLPHCLQQSPRILSRRHQTQGRRDNYCLAYGGRWGCQAGEQVLCLSWEQTEGRRQGSWHGSGETGDFWGCNVASWAWMLSSFPSCITLLRCVR